MARRRLSLDGPISLVLTVIYLLVVFAFVMRHSP